MICVGCQHENPVHAKFCLECGAPFGIRCSNCQTELPADAKFCLECGSAVARSGNSAASVPTRDPSDYTPRHLADKILHARSALEGERKRVTVLFADIQGSMALSERIDAETWHNVMDRFFAIMTEGVHHFEGTINQYTGDGVMALFGAPIAHEDHAQRACFAALYLQNEIRECANELRVQQGLPIAVRFGLNSGDVVVGRIGDDLRMDYTAQGHTVGLAARMQEIAEPGRTYLADATAKLVRGYFELESIGRTEIKGLSEPVEVFVLEGVGEMRTRLQISQSRGLSKFVGRVAELDILRKAFERVAGGGGEIVGIVAEAGTGKSRLCLEFMTYCHEHGVTTYESHCLPHGRALPMYPVLELYRAVFGLQDGDSPEHARDKIAGRMVLMDESLLDSLPLLFDFMGVPDPARPIPPTDPELRTRHVIEVLARFTLARSEREPVVVLLEDLHWMDPGSAAFFDALINVVPAGRVLLLMTFRPEYQGTWTQRSFYSQIPLNPLGANEIRELLDHLLGYDPSLLEIRTRITDRTGGNPFFVEEVVRELSELGHIEGTPGNFRLVAKTEGIPVPDSVQGVLAARIDRLEDDAKLLLQGASTIGRKFSQKLLAAITEREPGATEPGLATLTENEFIYPEVLYPEAQYTFKHALTRDVTYQSMLGERRKRLHAAIAHELDKQTDDSPQSGAALIAHHYEEAGETLPAATWHERAAAWIGMRNAGESYQHWNRARELLAGAERDPSILSRHVQACCQAVARGLRSGVALDTSALLSEARDALAGCDDPAAEIRILEAEGSIPYLQGRFAHAFPLLDDALRQARRIGNPTAIASVLPFWLIVQTWRDPSTGLAVLNDIGDIDVEGFSVSMGFQAYGFSRCWRGTCATYLGRYAEADAAFKAAMESARNGGDAIDLALTTAVSSVFYSLWGDRDRAASLVREARRLAEATGVRMAIATSCMVASQSLDAVGLPFGDDELAELVQRLEQLAYGHQQPALSCGRSQLAYRRGDFQHALQASRETLRKLDDAGMVASEPLGRIIEAQAIMALNGPDAKAEVRSVLAQADATSKRLNLELYRPHLHRARAQLAILTGDHVGAERQLEEGRAAFEAMGAPVPASFERIPDVPGLAAGDRRA